MGAPISRTSRSPGYKAGSPGQPARSERQRGARRQPPLVGGPRTAARAAAAAAAARCRAASRMVEWKKVGRRLQAFVVDNYLPLSFLVVIVWALAWPAPGLAVVSVTVSLGLRYA